MIPIPDWFTRTVALIIGGIILAIAISGWLWWNFHMNAKNAAAVPKAQAVVNKAQANAGGRAVNTVNQNQDKNAKTDTITRNNTYVTNNYPAAKVEVDADFIAAFDHAICLYASAASIPECQRLQQPNP